MQALYSVAGVVGPGIAGLMVSKLGYVTPLLTNAATFAALALLPAFLVLPFHGREIGRRERGDIWIGLQIVRSEPVIRALTILLFCLTVVLGAFDVAILFFILGDLHSTQFTYGLVTSVFAAGGFVAALINERRDVSEAQLPVNIIAGALMAGIGVLLTGFVWHLALLLPTFALAGIGGSTLTAYATALILQRAPELSRARVISAVQAVMSIAALMALAVAGAVVSVIDPRFAILLSGAICLLVVGVLAPTLRRSSRPAADI
jgi:MFS family permease